MGRGRMDGMGMARMHRESVYGMGRGRMRGMGMGRMPKAAPGRPRGCTGTLSIEGTPPVQGVKMALVPYSHQILLIQQAWKGLDPPDKEGQAGRDPPGAAKAAAAPISFPDTRDSTRSSCQRHTPISSKSFHSPESISLFFFSPSNPFSRLV